MSTNEKALLARYRSIINGCYGNSDKTYRKKNGIKVCQEWLGENGFQNFYKWAVSNGFSPELVIDRIDTYGDYSPENCRWVTYTQNNRNKRNTVFVEHEGKLLPLSEFCESFSLPYNRTFKQIRRGWTSTKVLRKAKRLAGTD